MLPAIVFGDPYQLILFQPGVITESRCHPLQSQFAHQYPSTDAVVNDVVLQVDAALSIANQLGACGESLGTIGIQAKARLAPMGAAWAWIERPNAESFAGKA